MKYDYQYIKERFGEKGYILLTTEDEIDKLKVTDKLRFICPKHHDKGELEITFSKLINGQGCKYCGRERAASKRLKSNNVIEKECQELCESKGFIYQGFERKRINGISVINIKFICPHHKQYGVQIMRKNNMNRDIHGCQYCASKNLDKADFVKRIYQIHPDIELLSEYIGSSQPIQYRCKIHNYISTTTPSNLLQGRGCYYCGLEHLKQIATKSHNDFVDEVYKINSDIEILSEYKGRLKDITIRCKKCGKTFITPAYKLYKYSSGCPRCNVYSGEYLISNLLDGWGIEYKTQFWFSDCRDIRPLKFDFYLPQDNTCIEFDGIQHYEPIAITRGLSEEKSYSIYEYTIKHDLIKNEYCKNNKINLIRVPYWEQEDDNVEYFLFDELCKYNIIKTLEQ